MSPRKHGPIALLPLLALLAPGCIQDTSPTALQLRGNGVVLRLPGGGQGTDPGDCVKDQTLYYRPYGTLDLMMATKYAFFPELANRLKPTASVSGNQVQNLRSDASTITVRGAEVTARVLPSNAGPYSAAADLPASAGWVNKPSDDGSFSYFTKTWFSPFSATVEADNLKMARFDLIPNDIGGELHAAWFKGPGDPNNFAERYTTTVPIILDITVEGVMADGTVVRTQKVPYPIELCWGCLLTLPTPVPDIQNSSASYIYAQCSSKLTDAAFTPPCVPGNDEYIPCTFYCHMCQSNESITTGTFAQQYGCDTHYCPKESG